MRLLTLRFSRLNSLRQAVTLDFADGPIAEAGLFGITGPTGAGKSTILDAVCLALYGQTARGQGPEIISRGEREAEAEVEFAAQGRMYRAYWHLRMSKPRKADTAPRPTTTMELSRIASPGAQGELIAEGLRGERTAAGEVERITGLDFARFQQSVLLAQGHFDAFLAAKPTERSELLEQITGTAVYSELSQWVYRRHEREDLALAERRRSLERHGLPDEEAQAAWRERQTALAAEVERREATLERLRATRAQYLRQAELLAAGRELAERERAHGLEEAEVAAQRERLTRHDQTAAGADDLHRLGSARAELTRLAEDERRDRELAERQSQEVTALAEGAAFAKTTLASATEALQDARAAATELRGLAEVLATAAREVEGLTAERQAQREAAAQHAACLAELAAADQRHAADRRALTEVLDRQAAFARVDDHLPGLRPLHASLVEGQRVVRDLTARREAAQRQLKEVTVALARHADEAPPRPSGLAADADAAEAARAQRHQLDERRAELAWLSSFGAELRGYVEAHDEHRQREAQLADANRAHAQRTRELAVHSERHAELTQGLQAAEGIARVAQEALDAVRVSNGLRAEHLHRFVAGDPCPICGALEHPARAEGLVEVDLTPHQRRLEDATRELRARREAHGGSEQAERLLRDELTRAEALVETRSLDPQAAEQLAERHDELAAAYHARRGERAVFDRNLLTALRASFAALEAEVTALAAEQQTLVAYRDAAARHREAGAGLRARRQAATETVQAIETEALRVGRELEVVRQRFDEALATTGLPTEGSHEPDYLQRVRDARDRYQRDAARLLELDQEAKLRDQQRTTARTEQARAAERVATLTERLTQLDAQLVTDRARHQSLLGGAADADGLLAAATERHRLAAERAAAADQQLSSKREASAATQERVRGYAERRQRLDLTVRQARTALERLVDELGFANVDALQAARLAPELVGRLREQVQAYEQTRVRLATERLQLDAALRELTAALAEAEPHERVEAQLAGIKDAQDSAQRELGGLERQLTEAERRREEHARESAALAELGRVVDDWSTLNGLIGSASGGKFRQFAQGITLQRLVAFANEHLARIYPRFSIAPGTQGSGDELELYVCDHYEADHIRSVSTASGGERFLISLALALGFSQMASRNMRIDTLFIDEGFGTLDGETLDKAMDALERLRESGKTIGLISHVESLRERLPVQVRVRRVGSGRSQVEVVDA